jgi:hypothetical protein
MAKSGMTGSQQRRHQTKWRAAVYAAREKQEPSIYKAYGHGTQFAG